MKNSAWSKEEVWVARDANGNIIRAQDTSPTELLAIAEGLRKSGTGEEPI